MSRRVRRGRMAGARAQLVYSVCGLCVTIVLHFIFSYTVVPESRRITVVTGLSLLGITIGLLAGLVYDRWRNLFDHD